VVFDSSSANVSLKARLDTGSLAGLSAHLKYADITQPGRIHISRWWCISEEILQSLPDDSSGDNSSDSSDSSDSSSSRSSSSSSSSSVNAISKSDEYNVYNLKGVPTITFCNTSQTQFVVNYYSVVTDNIQ